MSVLKQPGKRPRRAPTIIGALATLLLMLVATSWGSSVALASPGWSIQPTPNTGGTLNGVSCTSANACIAVGQANGAALAERWDGTAWATQPTPNPGTLLSVSCLAATSCTAVGSISGAPLAEQWAGGAWSVTLNQGAGYMHGVYLRGVSCTSASACTAAGFYVRLFPYPGHKPPFRAAYQTLAEQWNGTAWSVQTTPDEGTAVHNWLYSVSCTAANACIAVGGLQGVPGLAMRWDGTAWSIQNVSSPDYTLYGVSCTSATACTAVGLLTADIANSPSVYVDRWDGTRWWQQSVPLPPDAKAATLYGVSCPSAKACAAVGGYTTRSGVEEALAEEWNGTTWTVVPTPTPGGATSTTLAGVSCSSASTCTAVGNYVSSSGAQETLAEAYTG